MVSVELLDPAEKVLFAFNDELWAEGGESKTDYSATFNIPEKGNYSLRLSASLPPNQNPQATPDVTMRWGRTGGSAIPFVLLAIGAVVGGILIWFVGGSGGMSVSGISRMLVAFVATTWWMWLATGVIVLCIYFDVDCSD